MRWPGVRTITHFQKGKTQKAATQGKKEGADLKKGGGMVRQAAGEESAGMKASTHLKKGRKSSRGMLPPL